MARYTKAAWGGGSRDLHLHHAQQTDTLQPLFDSMST